MLETYVARILEREDLSESDAHAAMTAIMSGEATDAQIAGFLIALRMKGETVEEITGCASAMRQAATTVDVGGLDVVDTCGTGGDKSGTFNVSTAAAIVAAGAGVPIAKHGNRSVSSGSGSADVLRTLGVNLEADVPTVERCIREAGIGFLFAPALHKAMKYAIGPRRELAVRTVFNVLGPLTNPAGARRQVMGVFSDRLVETIAGVLKGLGAVRAMVVHSHDGLDELSICAESRVAELREDGSIRAAMLSPEDFGLERAPMSDLLVETPEQSAEVIRGVLRGEPGGARRMTVLNAAAAVYVGGRADSLAKAVDVAAEAVDSGAAKTALDKLVALSNG